MLDAQNIEEVFGMLYLPLGFKPYGQPTFFFKKNIEIVLSNVAVFCFCFCLYIHVLLASNGGICII